MKKTGTRKLKMVVRTRERKKLLKIVIVRPG